MCVCFLRSSRITGQRLKWPMGEAELAKGCLSIKVEIADFTKLGTRV